MKSSILEGKRILAVDDEPDVLEVLEDEVMMNCPGCSFDKANSYEEAVTKLTRGIYDLVILDIMGVRGFDLLAMAVSRNLKVAMLTAHALSPETLKKAIDLGARAYLPKEKIGEIVPFLEDILTHDFGTGWKRLYGKLKEFFDSRFESDWEKKVGLNWQQIDRHT